MTPVKRTTKKAATAETVKASTKKAAETVKTETKKAAETVKTETKKAADAVKEETKKVTAAVKEETKKVSEAVKEEPKKAEAKKAAPKKAAAKKTPQVKTYVEFFGKQISTQAIAEQIENQNTDKKIETLEIYVKPEENAAYYVINGEGNDSFRIDL